MRWGRGARSRGLGVQFALVCALACLPWGQAAAQPSELLAGTAQSQVLGAHQRSRVQPAFEALTSGDQARFLDLLRGAQTQIARDLLLKALSSGNSLSEITRFSSAIQGKKAAWLMENTQLCGCTGVRQQFSHTCQVTTLQAMRGRYDPIYALKLRMGNADIAKLSLVDATELNPKLAAEQQRMLEAIYRGEVTGATSGIAKSRKEWKDGKRRYLDDLLNELRESTGLSYRTRRVTDVGQATDLLLSKLRQGIATPMIIGEAPGRYTHHILAYGVRETSKGAEILIHDPWEARSTWLSEAEIRAGKIQTNPGSVLKHLTYLEVPSRVEGAPQVKGLGPLERTLLERYLAERRGIGSDRARSLIETFGSQTVEVIERTPERLVEAPGVGSRVAAKIETAWAELKGLRVPGLEAPGAGAELGTAPKGDLLHERALIEADRLENERLLRELAGERELREMDREREGKGEAEQEGKQPAKERVSPKSPPPSKTPVRVQKDLRLARLLRVASWRAKRAAAQAETEGRLRPLRRADGTLDWKELRARGPKRVLGEVGGVAHFGLALFLKEVAVVARTGDALRMQEFFDGLLTTDFYTHYGLFVAGARVTEVAYVKYLQRYVKPRFVNGLLKTNLVLAAGMALPLLVEGKLEGKAFVISVASLGLSTSAVRGGVAGLKWVSSLRRARQTGALAKVASASRLARVGGWFYTAAELAVILYVGEEIDKRITAVVDERAARAELQAAGRRFLDALADPNADLAAASDAYHAAHNDFRNYLYRPLEQDEMELARRLAGVARRAKLNADQRRVTLEKLKRLPSLRARALRDFPTLEAYAEHLVAEDEAQLQEEVRGVFKSYERVRAKHLEEVYAGPRRKTALLAEVSDVDWVLGGARPGEAGDPSQGRSDLFGRKARERSVAGLEEALGEVSGNRLQAYDDERELIARARAALSAGGARERAAVLGGYLARIDRLRAADRQLYQGTGTIDFEARQGAVDQIRREVEGR